MTTVTNLENMDTEKLLKLWYLAGKEDSLEELYISCSTESMRRADALLKETLIYLKHHFVFDFVMASVDELEADLHIKAQLHKDIPFDVTVKLKISYYSNVIGFLVYSYDAKGKLGNSFSAFSPEKVKNVIMKLVTNKKAADKLKAIKEINKPTKKAPKTPLIPWGTPSKSPFGYDDFDDYDDIPF